MSELKPCPFCGHESELVGSSAGFKWVLCPSCEARGPLIEPVQQCSDDDCCSAAYLWNTRAPQSEWISIDKKMPPISTKPENGDPDMVYTHTDDVIVLCSNGDIHRSYHDGDVWCYHNLSGCPQWDVIAWMPLPTPLEQ